MAEQSWGIVTDDTDGVRTIVVDNPPVNALSLDVRIALIAALDAAMAEASVAAVVLGTGGRTFFSGADIRELDSPVSPRVFHLTAHIESLPKPVVAAIRGAAFGGGLEVALACHGRVAQAGSKIGFPEVKLGLIPGAGGTQYAPRLIGPIEAVALICSGNPLDAGRARDLSLLDAVVEADLLPHAQKLARELANGDAPLRRVRDLPVPPCKTEDYEAAVKKIVTRARHQNAVAAAIEAVDAAMRLTFEEGIAKERALFEALRTGQQSKALRYQFFAERQATRVDGVSPETPVKTVENVGIVGGGTMGRGIALAFLAAGYAVSIAELDEQHAAAAMDAIVASLQRDHERGRLTAEQFEGAKARCSVRVGDAGAVGDVDLVVEAAFEDMAIKKEIFAVLDESMPPPTILATNTSSLDINQIAAATHRPDAVVGMHFFSPANIMRLLEIVRAEGTSPETLATVLAVAKRLRKTAVVVGVCDGFVGNRMLAQRHIAAERLLLEGALPAQVDKAWVDFGFPMGVFAMTDLAGVDVNWRVRKARGSALAIHDAIYERGRYGQKTGAGFYRYEQGQRVPIPDPEIEHLIVATSASVGVTRRAISDEEIVERLLFPMINEGARILEERIAQRASDIDVVWVNGYGWPAWRGGPMYHADTIGLRIVADRLARMRQETGDARLEPAPLLLQLAESGGRFAD